MKKVDVIVKKDFVCRYTGKKCKAGDRLTVSDERFREMKRSNGFVEIAKALVNAEPKK